MKPDAPRLIERHKWSLEAVFVQKTSFKTSTFIDSRTTEKKISKKNVLPFPTKSLEVHMKEIWGFG